MDGITTASVGFEKQLWAAADKLRGSLDASEYKHVVLGLVFLKYISDKFNIRYKELVDEGQGFEEDRDEYIGHNTFYVPPSARWDFVAKSAHLPDIGKIVDEAMVAIERENSRLKNVLPKNFSRPELDKRRLGEVIDLFTNVNVAQSGEGKDVLGRVYEYFLSMFASAEGKRGGEFFTPSYVVRTLVEVIEPFHGRVYDPCCGSGGMFVQSAKFVEAHGGNPFNISVYGQESNPTTWKMCAMNLAVHGIEADLGPQNADTFHNDLHRDLRADFVLANPPFNLSDWGGERLREDPRWRFGIPPAGNANYAWIEHMFSKLAPTGRAGFVLANGSLSTQTGGEGEIRKRMIKDYVVECIVSLPPQLFYSTQIPVSLWFLSRRKERPGEILFIDARKLGYMEDRVHKALSDADIARIAGTCHAWRTQKDYSDVPGFCKAATLKDVEAQDFILTPGRYVGLEAQEEDVEDFEEKMARLTGELAELFEKSHRMEEEIRKQLGGIGYEF